MSSRVWRVATKVKKENGKTVRKSSEKKIFDLIFYSVPW